MIRYFLDTHVVIWLITNDLRLDENLRLDIEYPSGHQFVTSEYVILELIQLKQLGKINYKGTAADLFKILSSMNIGLNLIRENVFDALDKIPILTLKKKTHSDMIDRIIIADCIANRYTMVSHDAKFPYYRKYGLDLLEV